MLRKLWIALLVSIAFTVMVSPANADFTINVSGILTTSQIVYISDLDVLQTGAAPLLFTLSITETGQAIADPWARIRLFNGSNELLVTGKIRLSNIPRNGNTWSVTNQHFSTGQGSWDGNDSLSSRYQNQVLRTGMIPIDTYRFVFDVLAGQNGPTQPTERQWLFNVRGSGYVQLRFPDNDLRGQTPMPSTLPFFVWQSSQELFSIKISEIGAGETPETALQNRTNCAATGITSTSFQYPSSGVVPLEPGKYYAWQVMALVQTSSGAEYVPSEIRVFRIAPIITPEGSQLMVGLQQLLTSGPGARILEQIQNGSPDGVIYINGVPISTQQFFAMLSEFISGRYTIVSIRVE